MILSHIASSLAIFLSASVFCVCCVFTDITNTFYILLIFHTDVEYAVECHVEAGILGVEQVPVAFQFRLEDSSQPFFIIRTIVCGCFS